MSLYLVVYHIMRVQTTGSAGSPRNIPLPLPVSGFDPEFHPRSWVSIVRI